MILDKHTRFVKENKPERHYIKNEDLLRLLSDYNKTKVISDELGEAFLIMAKNLAKARNFRNIPYIEDCIQVGVMCCIKYIYNFDVEVKDNPFGYFTQCMKFAFVNVIKKEKRKEELHAELAKYDVDGYRIESQDREDDWMSNSLFNENDVGSCFVSNPEELKKLRNIMNEENEFNDDE